MARRCTRHAAVIQRHLPTSLRTPPYGSLAVVWLFWTGDNLWGIVLRLWSAAVGTLDNFLRPFLIKKGTDLPLLLIFAGVIGGLLSFGLPGIFAGPVVLAVTLKLLHSWVNETGEAAVAADVAT